MKSICIFLNNLFLEAVSCRVASVGSAIGKRFDKCQYQYG